MWYHKKVTLTFHTFQWGGEKMSSHHHVTYYLRYYYCTYVSMYILRCHGMCMYVLVGCLDRSCSIVANYTRAYSSKPTCCCNKLQSHYVIHAYACALLTYYLTRYHMTCIKHQFNFLAIFTTSN